MTIFDELIKRTSQFVEKQKGIWDHTKWQGFLSDIQEKGVNLTEETRNYLGSVVESMKKFYENSSDTGKKLMGIVSDQVAQFVEKTKGKWDHLGWEKFVKDIQKKGIDLTDETRSNLGVILESAKRFYSNLPLKAPEVKKEKEITEVQEKPETPKVPEAKTSEKPAKQLKKEVAEKKAKAEKPVKTFNKKEVEVPKAQETKKPKKKGRPSQKKSTEKEKTKEIKQTKKPKSTKTGKAAHPIQDAAAQSIVKKPTVKGTTKTKTSLRSKKKTKKK